MNRYVEIDAWHISYFWMSVSRPTLFFGIERHDSRQSIIMLSIFSMSWNNMIHYCSMVNIFGSSHSLVINKYILAVSKSICDIRRTRKWSLNPKFLVLQRLLTGDNLKLILIMAQLGHNTCVTQIAQSHTVVLLGPPKTLKPWSLILWATHTLSVSDKWWEWRWSWSSFSSSAAPEPP